METHYLLIEGSKMKEFEEALQFRLNEGWEPLGDIAIRGGGKRSIRYAQSLILKSK